MKYRMHRIVLPMMLAAVLPTLAVAQAPGQGGPSDRPERPRAERLSPDARARLLDGRLAMIRTTLKLNDAQLKLWAPVEAQMRDQAAQRDKMRAEREALRGNQDRQRPSMSDRLERGSQSMAQRAERMKAFANVYKPFYDSLNEEQKQLADVVMRQGRGHGGPRWAMQRGERGGELR